MIILPKKIDCHIEILVLHLVDICSLVYFRKDGLDFRHVGLDFRQGGLEFRQGCLDFQQVGK